jgi:tetratricopeptide (TPR) repeat protein
MAAYNKLGDVYFEVDLKPSLALAEYQKAYILAEMLAKADPADAQAQRDLSVSYINLGDVTLQLERTAQALEFYEKSLTIREALVKTDPADAQGRLVLSS